MKFKLSKPIMPSDEEIQKRHDNYVSVMASYSLKNIPDEIKNVFDPFVIVPTDEEELKLMINESNENPITLIDKIKKVLDENKWELFFIKYFTRSAKDANYNMSKPYQNCEEGILEAIYDMKGSMRCFEDIAGTFKTKKHKDELCFIVKPFLLYAAERKNEFRCFLKENGVTIITQYYTDSISDYPVDYVLNRAKILVKLLRISKPNLRNVVFDFYIDSTGDGNIIEFNPFHLSDPIRFRDDYLETIYSDDAKSTIRGNFK